MNHRLRGGRARALESLAHSLRKFSATGGFAEADLIEQLLRYSIEQYFPAIAETARTLPRLKRVLRFCVRS